MQVNMAQKSDISSLRKMVFLACECLRISRKWNIPAPHQTRVDCDLQYGCLIAGSGLLLCSSSLLSRHLGWPVLNVAPDPHTWWQFIPLPKLPLLQKFKMAAKHSAKHAECVTILNTPALQAMWTALARMNCNMGSIETISFCDWNVVSCR